MPYRITVAARADLLDIGRYTQKRWGVEQWRKYLAHLQTAFSRVAEHPQLGTPCPEIRRGYLQLFVARHRVFYRLGDDGVVEIIRVLHQSMCLDHI